MLRLWVLRGINSRFCGKTQWQMFLLVSDRHVGAHLGGHQHGGSIQISINLGKTFLLISSVRKIAVTWILARGFAYLPSFYFQILDLIDRTVFIFLFWSILNGVTLKTSNTCILYLLRVYFELMNSALLILTNEKSACLNGAGCLNYLLAVAKKLCDMTSDRGSGISNQLPSTGEIMPDVYHNDLNNTQDSRQIFFREKLYLNRVVPECQITNKVNKEGDKRKHRSHKKITRANWCVWLSSWRKATPVSGEATYLHLIE